MKVHYAIMFVSDMKRSIAFYQNLLSMPPQYQTPEWTEFAIGGANIALHATRLQPGLCRPGLSTPDLTQFHRRMTELGVPCALEPAPTFGSWIAQYSDPDGLVISVRELI